MSELYVDIALKSKEILSLKRAWDKAKYGFTNLLPEDTKEGTVEVEEDDYLFVFAFSDYGKTCHLTFCK